MASRLQPFLSCFLCILFINQLRNVSAADCTAQSSESGCKLVSGCEWFDNQYGNILCCKAHTHTHTKYRCQCATDVKVDIIFAIDRSGSIGSSAFKQAKSWLSDFVRTALPKDPRIGFVYFASSVDASDITLKTWTTSSLVSYISNMRYTGGGTVTGYAVDASITEYAKNGLSSRQKLVMMITDGKPNGGGDVCTRAAAVKANDIRVVMIGVGSGITSKYVECLLQDASTDYIPVKSYNYDDFSKIMPALQEITCPVSYNMKLTEVKPLTDTNPSFGAKFIEIWNIGSTVNGADLSFEGFVNGKLPNSVSLKQSQFLVLFDADSVFKNVSCVNCECNSNFVSPFAQILPTTQYFCGDSLYFACSQNSKYCTFDSSMDATNWNQKIYDISNNANEQIDSVEYDAQSNWPSILNGFTFELKKIGFENNVGSNWEQSCYQTGTPGDERIDCPHSDCSATTCQQNGDTNAAINPNSGVCTCTNGYYPTGCTCMSIPQPSNCLAERVKNLSNSNWFTLYYWDRAQYDESIQYELQYQTDGGSTTTVTSYGLIKTVLNYDWQNRGISSSAGTLRSFVTDKEGKNYYSQSAECLPITMDPTTEPTAAPTFSPSNAPTNIPTISPIHDLPWLFIGGGICEVDRCECAANKNQSCCMMDEVKNCTQHSKNYVFSQYEDKKQFINIQSFDPFGNAYSAPFDTTLFYEFEYLGLQNLTSSQNDSNCADNVYDNDDSPVSISPMNGSIVFDEDAASSTQSISFLIESTGVGTTQCRGDAMYRLSLLSCLSNYTLNTAQKCEIVYPNDYILYIEQPRNAAALSWYERSLKPILWWLIAGMAVLLLLVALAVYQFWYKTKIKGRAIKEKDEDLQALIEEEELGMAPDLQSDNFGYNPLALGSNANNAANGSDVAGMGGNEKIPENQRANVMVEKFNVKQQYGQSQGINNAADANTGYQPPSIHDL